jgi:hypothetical protein
VSNLVVVSNTIPLSLSLDVGSIDGASEYDPDTRLLRWMGILNPGEIKIIRYEATPIPSLTAGSLIDNIVWIGYDHHDLVFKMIAPLWIDAPDYSDSILSATSSVIDTTQIISYSLFLVNNGSAGGQITATVHLPDSVNYITMTLQSQSGLTHLTDSGYSWHGDLGPSETVTVSMVVTVPLIARSDWLSAAAYIDDGLTNVIVREEFVQFQPYLHFFPALFGPPH